MALITHFNTRLADTPVDELFLTRWSPRSFDSTYVMTQDELNTLLESARWSWSSNNLQPWRYVYGLKGSPSFKQILSCLTGGNQSWAERASCLMLILAKTTKQDGMVNTSALFDTGAATMSMSLQAKLLGLVDHHMGGMDRILAKASFCIPDDYSIHCISAIGKLGNPNQLNEHDQQRELPNTRLPIKDLAKTMFDF